MTYVCAGFGDNSTYPVEMLLGTFPLTFFFYFGDDFFEAFIVGTGTDTTLWSLEVSNLLLRSGIKKEEIQSKVTV